MIFKKSNNEELFALPHDEIITEELTNKLQAYHDNNQYFEEKFKFDPETKEPMLGASYIITGDGKIIYLSGYSHGYYIQSLLDNYARESLNNRQEVKNLTDVYQTIHYVFDGGIRAYIDYTQILILTGFQLPNSKQLETIRNLPLNEIIFEFELNNGKTVSGIGDYNKLENTIKKVRQNYQQNSPQITKQISLEPTTKPLLPTKQLFPNKHFTKEQLELISKYPVPPPEYQRTKGGSLNTTILKRAEILDQNKKYISSDNLINIYKKISKKFIKIANEYWFYENEVKYADGDVGDLNHEMIAEDYLIREKVYLDSFDNVEAVTEDYLDSLAPEDEDFIDFLMNTYNYSKEDAIDNAYGNNYLLWLISGQIENPTPEYNELMAALKDPRKYMVDNRGWIRVQGKNIETYNLDKNHLDEIVHGLQEIYYSDYFEDVPEENPLDNMTFNIEVTSINKYFEDVTFDELVTGDVRKRLRDISDVPKMPRTFYNPQSFYKDQGG